MGEEGSLSAACAMVLIGLRELQATSDIHGLSVPSSAVSLEAYSKIKHRLKVTMR